MTEAAASAPPAEAEEEAARPSPAAPPWTVEKPTPEEAIYFLELRAGETMGYQYRLVEWGYRKEPDREQMREAFVMRYLATQLRFKLFKEGKPQP